MKPKKAQSSTELLLLISILFLLFFAVMYYNRWELVALLEDKRQSQLHDMAEVLETEIQVALEAEEGYIREFKLPRSLTGKGYKILFAPEEEFTEVMLEFTDESKPFETSFLTSPSVDGTIIIGTSRGTTTITIKKSADRITLNSI